MVLPCTIPWLQHTVESMSQQPQFYSSACVPSKLQVLPKWLALERRCGLLLGAWESGLYRRPSYEGSGKCVSFYDIKT